MLVEQDLFGNVRDKVQTAIDIARMFEPKDEPYILADSGGKDSACVKRVLDMAGVRYEAVYNVTTVDPPELVRHIISQYYGVIYDMPYSLTACVFGGISGTGACYVGDRIGGARWLISYKP